MARPRKKQEEVEPQADAAAEEPEVPAEEPAAEEKPKKRAPRKKKADEPVAEEVPEEPVAEEPVAEEAVADEPAPVEEPVAEPVAEEPVAEEPVAEEPVDEEPAPEPVGEEPVAEEPVAEEPAPEPVAAEAPAEVPARKPKRKRMPRAQRRQRPKPARGRTGTRKPITRLPKPENVRSNRKERRGIVVSDAMDKTIVVRVDTLKAHPVYKKVVRRSRRLHAHDELNAAKAGDVVRIVETRPFSKTKTWRLAEVLEEAK
jgi:small subunit ribosomal protein S17